VPPSSSGVPSSRPPLRVARRPRCPNPQRRPHRRGSGPPRHQHDRRSRLWLRLRLRRPRRRQPSGLLDRGRPRRGPRRVLGGEHVPVPGGLDELERVVGSSAGVLVGVPEEAEHVVLPLDVVVGDEAGRPAAGGFAWRRPVVKRERGGCTALVLFFSRQRYNCALM
jgi:hypothetical protein